MSVEYRTSLQRLLDKVDEPLYDVFLGGSCGATTWRKDVAIPRLNQIECSYYDPQSDEWREDMLQKEAFAKSSCRILFWVVHPSSSSIVTLIEIAHFAAVRAPLMVVFLDTPNIALCTTKCGVATEEARKSRAFVKWILQENKFPVFTSVEDGVDAVQRRLLLSRPHLAVSKNKRLKKLYLNEKHKCEREERNEKMVLQLRTLVNLVCAFLLDSLGGGSCGFSSVRLMVYVWELGLVIVLGHVYSCPLALLCLLIFFSFIANSLLFPPIIQGSTINKRLKPAHYDIFVGGGGHNLAHFAWIDTLAAPKIQQYGFSYMHGGYLLSTEWNNKAAIYDNCRLILFTLLPNMSIFSAMVELAHMAGKYSDKLIVCLPSENDFIHDMNDRWLVTCTRACCYLKDILREARIYYTTDINAAIEKTVTVARRTIRI